MRSASTYRGARRNSYVSAAKGTRFFGWNAWETANAKADLGMRGVQANNAREAAAKAMVVAGATRGPHTVNFAFLDFYTVQKRTRVVNRIISALVKSLPKQRAA